MRLIIGQVFLGLLTAICLSSQATPPPVAAASTVGSSPVVAVVPPAPVAVPAGGAPATEPIAAGERVALDPKFAVTKVHVVNNTEGYKDGGNSALKFELKYWNYGAITAADFEARRGQIYVISWRNSGPPANLTARFEYRMVQTKDKIYAQKLDFPTASGTKRAIFQVVGEEYRKLGPVYSWRFTILRGDQVVALERSYIW